MAGLRKRGPSQRPRKVRRGSQEPAADAGAVWDHRLRAGLGQAGYIPAVPAADPREQGGGSR